MVWRMIPPDESDARDIEDLIGRDVVVEMTTGPRAFHGVLAGLSAHWATLHDAFVVDLDGPHTSMPPHRFLMRDMVVPLNRVLYLGEVHADLRGTARNHRPFIGPEDQPHAFEAVEEETRDD